MLEYLEALPADTAQMLALRVVRVKIAAEGEGESDKASTFWYKVVTSPIGFVNHFTQLSNQPNCSLMWKEGLACGQYNLVIQASKAIKVDKQWLLNYGPMHLCGQKPVRKGKRLGPKRAKIESAQ